MRLAADATRSVAAPTEAREFRAFQSEARLSA
jgi:hypothetical protein